MKRFVLLLTGALLLSGCAGLSNAYQIATSASVPRTTVYVAVNGFDVLETTATSYLKLPRCTGVNGPVCRSPTATKAIIPAIRSGRVARNNLEQFLKDNPGALGPSGLYNALVTSANTLQGIYAQYNIGGTQ